MHQWDVTPSEAIRIQRRLADSVREEEGPGTVELVAGADVSYERHAERFYAGVVVCRLPEMEVVETGRAVGRSTFPYVPGLLSFREGPILLEAFAGLKAKPDVILFDGQGRAHGRRFGLACHMGVLLDSPSIGCAKSRLVGEHREPGARRGSRVRLTDRGEVIGTVLRTRDNVKPVYVSVGHRVNLPGAVKLVLATARRYRLPEPIRHAHNEVNRMRLAERGREQGIFPSLP